MNHLMLAGTLSNAKRGNDGDVSGVLTFLFPQWDKGQQREVLTPATLDIFISQRVMLNVEATGKKIASTPGMIILVEGSLDIDKQSGKPERYTFYAANVMPLGVGIESAANTIVVAGNLGQDPDVKYFDSGSVSAKITVATRKFQKNADRPDWHAAQAMGKTAEFIAQYIRKGQTVSLKGVLIKESWTDKQTQAPRFKFVIRIDRLNPLGKSENGNGNGDSNRQYASAAQASGGQDFDDPLDDF